MALYERQDKKEASSQEERDDIEQMDSTPKPIKNDIQEPTIPDKTEMPEDQPTSTPAQPSNINSVEPKPEEKKHLGYLSSYLEPEKHGAKKQDGAANPWLNKSKQVKGKDKKASEIYSYDTSTDRHVGEKWHSDALINFFEDPTSFEDPTYLGFDILFLADESPLFNYDQIPPITNSVNRFISLYSSIKEVAEREQILQTFLTGFMDYFSVFGANASKPRKKHYVEQVDGLDKLSKKIVEYEKDIIEITLNEDVALRTQFLADLYNNLLYDYKSKKQIIPENTLRFNMLINIKDIRDFKTPNPDYNPNDPSSKAYVFTDRFGGTYTTYKLLDCNFDFVESQTHEGTMKIAGWSQFDQGNMNNTKLKIKYKSITKVTASILLDSDGQMRINNKDLNSLFADNDSFQTILMHQDHSRSNEIEENPEREMHQEPETQPPTSTVVIGDSSVNDVSLDIPVRVEQSEPGVLTENIGEDLSNISINDEAPTSPNLQLDQGDLTSNIGTDISCVHLDNEPPSGGKSASEGTAAGGVFGGVAAGIEVPIEVPSGENLIKDVASGLDLPTPDVFETGKNNLFGNLKDTFKDILYDAVDVVKKKLLNKFNEIRGELLSDIIKEIHSATGLPNMLGNVYSTDFRQLSIKNFANGLGNSMFNAAADAIGGAIMDKTDIFKQNAISDDSYLGDVDDIENNLK